jgi:AraC family transcriptional regulator, regulatory protein of adaptative response / DNA-3-methyladenine glycosylase II
MIDLDEEKCYLAVTAGDPRFDGVFYVGVTSTGIYCRTICRAKKPKRVNCRFFANSSLAELGGFRPCRLCRPEQSPGRSHVDLGSPIVSAAIRRIDSGGLSDGKGIESLATELNISSRHLRRVFQANLGVSPVQLSQTQRLLTAKRLLMETDLPITQIALASGFRSVRRCNALFKTVYAMAPTEFRNRPAEVRDSASITLTLGYRPPYAWNELLSYFRARAIPGVEHIADDCYSRTMKIGPHCGWFRVTNQSAKNSIQVEIAHELIGAVPALLARIRQAFDLDAMPAVIENALSDHPQLSESMKRAPGLRLPGAIDSFETAIRTIVGQQVSVAAATTVMGRLVRQFGERAVTPWPALNLHTISVERIARQSVDTLAPLGLNSARARAIVGLAQAVADGTVDLQQSVDPDQSIAALQTLDGIGPWTANYFGMRILGWPDAFIASDLVVRKQLAPLTVKQIETLSQAWRPWRGYAVMHLWHASGFFQNAPSTGKTKS